MKQKSANPKQERCFINEDTDLFDEMYSFMCHFPPQNGKDLVQEVAKLRLSLDDAEGLSRDARKEWAILRSQNLSLEESVVSLH